MIDGARARPGILWLVLAACGDAGAGTTTGVTSATGLGSTGSSSGAESSSGAATTGVVPTTTEGASATAGTTTTGTTASAGTTEGVGSSGEGSSSGTTSGAETTGSGSSGGGAVCGDGVVGPGETCDDGSGVGCDTYHDGGDGACVPAGMCSPGFVLVDGACAAELWTDHVHIMVDNTCTMTVTPPAFSVPPGQKLRLDYHNHSQDYPVDVWMHYNGGFTDLQPGATWMEKYEHCFGPNPSEGWATISTACSEYKLPIHCL